MEGESAGKEHYSKLNYKWLKAPIEGIKDDFFSERYTGTLNGKPYNLGYIHHDAIMEGSELIFEMGPEPNTEWGISK
ncbi:hypothetical protein [Maribacter polysiphoniae]|uniref:hypothetical protein n=1 Tax=Maribacter polysiphoniae TaxID=429344 RepID=UPI0023573EBD|nr:hypothetical protein [Maribacter polysiphoniae]